LPKIERFYVGQSGSGKIIPDSTSAEFQDPFESRSKTLVKIQEIIYPVKGDECNCKFASMVRIIFSVDRVTWNGSPSLRSASRIRRGGRTWSSSVAPFLLTS
jgi:hypothetical protein